MRLFYYIIFVAFGFGGMVSAQSAERVMVDLFFEIGESRYESASVLLRSGADYLERNEDGGHGAGHEAFKRLRGKSKNFTAVLAVERDGKLLFDSFNETSVLAGMDLSERNYYTHFQDTGSSDSAVVFPAIVAKQSGHLLIPIAMRVPEIKHDRARVVVTFLTPDSLIPNVPICPFCGLLVLGSQGKVVSSDRPMTETNQAIAEQAEFVGSYGSKDLKIRGFEVSLHWRKSMTSGLTYIYYEGKPKRHQL